jgi:hypothetical protein
MLRFAIARPFALLAALSLLPAAARAQSPVTITGCSQVVINGHAYTQYDLTFHNTTANYPACGIQLSRPFPGDAPDDTCAVVAVSGPPGFEPIGPSETDWWSDCNGPDSFLSPGESMGGFHIVTTRPCCWEVDLHNQLLYDDPTIGTVCLQCPTPARERTWGAVKATYR